MKQKLQKLLFAHKWMLYPFYVGLAIALICYGIKYCETLLHFVITFQSMTENDIMLNFLQLVDIVMVANLIKMVITGSYQVFVDRIKENTERVSSGVLKVKMGTSLIGITSIHLLQVFIKPPKDLVELYIKVGVHIVFLISAAVLALINLWDSKADLNQAKTETIEHVKHED
jgi:uncharacterized protein (TIGR00645 family)